MPNLGNVAKECLVMVGALTLKTKPSQFWARDGRQDCGTEDGHRAGTGAREEQILEEPSRRGLLRSRAGTQGSGKPQLNVSRKEEGQGQEGRCHKPLLSLQL